MSWKTAPAQGKAKRREEHMDLSSTTTDNVVEILSKIVSFTQQRHEILMQNIININNLDFMPRDMDVSSFAELMTEAVSEHLRNERLLMRDSENIKFGPNGQFKSLPIEDKHANKLLKKNIKEYLKLQITKLSENMVNQKVARELIKQGEG